MTTLHLPRHPLARMLAIARDGDAASTPLVLLVLLAAGLAIFIAVTLTVAMAIYELI